MELRPRWESLISTTYVCHNFGMRSSADVMSRAEVLLFLLLTVCVEGKKTEVRRLSKSQSIECESMGISSFFPGFNLENN